MGGLFFYKDFYCLKWRAFIFVDSIGCDCIKGVYNGYDSTEERDFFALNL